jgi:plasmid stabilization system protein ParE
VAAVRWAEPARDDLAEIYDFIARDSPGAALALVERILQATEQLASFPESGRLVPEFPELTYRELIVEATVSSTESRAAQPLSSPSSTDDAFSLTGLDQPHDRSARTPSKRT